MVPLRRLATSLLSFRPNPRSHSVIMRHENESHTSKMRDTDNGLEREKP